MNADDVSAWSALADRALDPNPFFRPEFVIPNARERSVPVELLVVRDGRVWLACLPVRRRSRLPQLPFRTIEALTDEYSFLGIPLVDRDRAAEAADGIIDVVRRTRTADAFVLGVWPPDSPVAVEIDAAARRGGAPPLVLGATRRAAWHRSPEGRSAGSRHPGDDRRKLASRARSLAKAVGGPVRVVDRSNDPAAWDAFLAMENSGWKAARGNPLAADPGDASFFRWMAAAMARIGRFELLALEGGGRTIAMESHLVEPTALYSFKIAYDPQYRRFAPGTQLKSFVIDGLHDRGFQLADSCASPTNAHMNRLWPGKRPIQTLLIPTSSQGAHLVPLFVTARSRVRRVRDVVAKRPVRAAAGDTAT
ncbi:MAG TPA: GNAT family N-acetyltransferase [Candidatus Limnocylindrales bacterium]|nr:GNAT family N-acetyltransferase [Candidatus Limnocylindrales bacterium]